MSSESFVIVVDTPSIKRYVFGTDSLNEVRGASDWLDRLNRVEMERRLCEYLGVEHVEQIYANGGSAQFLVRRCAEGSVKTACKKMVQYIRAQTGGEVQVVYGIAPLKGEASYQAAVQMAHFQLRYHREIATGHRSTSLMPIMMECKSASHLPAAHIVAQSADGIAMLSKASYEKDRHGRDARRRRHGLWAGWMQHLADTKPWPVAEQWDKLRCSDVEKIGDHSRGYIGVVYADGNAMGKIVQALDRPETFRQFSKIVDESIRKACFTALSQISQPEVNKIREVLTHSQPRFDPLAADILLLGGDDLLVAVPADRALDFALQATEAFERLTREKVAALPDAKTRQFFRDRLGDQGFTISCGVAIAKSNYPFYLSLDLAEQLLKNAKRQDSHDPQSKAQATRIDFHVVAGANSHVLKKVREDTYQELTNAPRTLRPLSRSQLETLRGTVQELHKVGFPRNKLHELQEAALTTEAKRADWHIRNIFVRCRHGQERSERRALWQAVANLCPDGYECDFPWFQRDGQRLLCIADLVEAYDLFQR